MRLAVFVVGTLFSLSSPLFSHSVGLSPAIEVQQPEISILHVDSLKVNLKVKANSLLSGDIHFTFLVPDSAGSDSTFLKATQADLSPEDAISEDFVIYLPAEGHYPVNVLYHFEEDPPDSASRFDSFSIYFAVKNGAVVAREDYLTPDPKYIQLPADDSDDSGASGASGAGISYSIKVKISGKIQYLHSNPREYRGIPGVPVFLDWYESEGQTLPPGHPRELEYTDDEGNYSYDFTFTSGRDATQFEYVRVFAGSYNGAAHLNSNLEVFPNNAWVEVTTPGVPSCGCGSSAMTMKPRRWRDVRVCGRTVWLQHCPLRMAAGSRIPPGPNRRPNVLPLRVPAAAIRPSHVRPRPACWAWPPPPSPTSHRIVRELDSGTRFGTQDPGRRRDLYAPDSHGGL